MGWEATPRHVDPRVETVHRVVELRRDLLEKAAREGREATVPPVAPPEQRVREVQEAFTVGGEHGPTSAQLEALRTQSVDAARIDRTLDSLARSLERFEVFDDPSSLQSGVNDLAPLERLRDELTAEGRPSDEWHADLADRIEQLLHAVGSAILGELSADNEVKAVEALDRFASLEVSGIREEDVDDLVMKHGRETADVEAFHTAAVQAMRDGNAGLLLVQHLVASPLKEARKTLITLRTQLGKLHPELDRVRRDLESLQDQISTMRDEYVGQLPEEWMKTRYGEMLEVLRGSAARATYDALSQAKFLPSPRPSPSPTPARPPSDTYRG